MSGQRLISVPTGLVPSSLSRRGFLGGAAVGVGSALAADMRAVNGLRAEEIAGELRRGEKHVILLWLAGGASQLETWDPKPGVKTGGPFAAIPTNVSGPCGSRSKSFVTSIGSVHPLVKCQMDS